MQFFLLSLIVLGLAAPAFADSWATDPVSGCMVWNDEDVSSGVTVIWSGECADDRASGSGDLTWFEDGKLAGRYSGDMNAGRFHGEGVLEVVSQDGNGLDRLEARFIDGVANGPGVFIGANGAYFEGSFANGRYEGFGLLTDPAGNFYEGFFSDGVPEGFGRSTLVSGDEYVGYFEKGLYDGDGSQLKANGEFYVGEFDDGNAVGFGRYEDASGGVYIGVFAGAVPSGPGSYFAADGTIYQGSFKDRKLTGEVLVTLPSGEQIREKWEDGEKVQ